jgi:hypothetical protein
MYFSPLWPPLIDSANCSAEHATIPSPTPKGKGTTPHSPTSNRHEFTFSELCSPASCVSPLHGLVGVCTIYDVSLSTASQSAARLGRFGDKTEFTAISAILFSTMVKLSVLPFLAGRALGCPKTHWQKIVEGTTVGQSAGIYYE